MAYDIEILTWKCEDVNMEFVKSFPYSRKQYDLILVVMDRMIRLTHFLPVKSTSFSAEDYAKLYI